MSFLLAAFLVVHGSIHIGYLCSQSWPFEATDPWLVSGPGVAAGTVGDVGVALVLVTFFGYLLAALSAVGIARRLWMPLIAVASVASAIVLVMFVTPSTLPGLAIDALLLWAVLVQRWQPTPLFGR